MYQKPFICILVKPAYIGGCKKFPVVNSIIILHQMSTYYHKMMDISCLPGDS